MGTDFWPTLYNNSSTSSVDIPVRQILLFRTLNHPYGIRGGQPLPCLEDFKSIGGIEKGWVTDSVLIKKHSYKL